MNSDLGEIIKKKPLILLNDAYWEPNIKEWVPKLMLDELDKEQKKIIVKKLFVIVLAPSNVSRCDSCGRIINKGTYRIGVPVYDRRGMYGIINRWNHIGSCSQKYLKKGIQGYNENSSKLEERLSDILFGWEYLPIGIKEEIINLSTKDDIINVEEHDIINTDNLVDRSIVEFRDTPTNLIYDLLKFQKEGLAWMCNQEKSIAKGGILADEMGMGKTIQTISLLLEHDIPPIIEDNNDDIIGKNLVIAPVAAVLQWKQEIEKFTKPGSLKVHIYHGSNRGKVKNKNIRQEYGGVNIDEADVVITTYPTLEAEYRKISSTFKTKCPYCDKSYLKRTLSIHLRYFCGPNARRTAKQALTERKRDGLKKAMRTLKIGLEEGVDKAKQLEDIARSLPTISNVYREILAKADLLDEDTLASSVPWFSKRNNKRQSIKEDKEINKEEIIHKKENSLNKKNKEISCKNESDKLINKKEVDKNENINLLLEWGGVNLPLKSSTVKSIKNFLTSIENSKDHLINRFDIKEDTLNKLIKLGNNSKHLKKLELIEELSKILNLNFDNNVNHLKRSKLKSKKSEKKSGKKKLKKNDYEYSEQDDSDYENYSDEDYSENEYETDEYNKDNNIEDISEIDIDEIDNNENVKIEDQTDEEEEIVLKLRDYSGIFERNWNRIILDEAHRIKARTTSTAKAIFALKCRGTKWCLTGTPLQNRVGELYSLVRFVGFHPYAYYFCQKNGCSCRQLNYVNHMKYCHICGHARSCHFSYFNKMIINPIKRYGFSGEGSEAIKRLKEEVLDKVLLRRTKIQRQEDVKLPPLNIKVIFNELSPAEKDFYTSLYQRSKVQFDTFVNQGTILHNYAHVFDLISRLRQAVDHPYLIVYGKFNNKKYEDNEEINNEVEKNDNFDTNKELEEIDNRKTKVIPSKSRASNNEDLCYLCMDNVTMDQRVTSKCKHGFHIKCIREYIDQAPQVEEYVTDDSNNEETVMRGVLGCPVCYIPLTINFNQVKEKVTTPIIDQEEYDINDNMELEKQEEQIERDLERLEMAKKLGIEIQDDNIIQNKDNKEDSLSCVRNKNIIRQIRTQGFESSTKIDSLLEEVNKMILEDPDAKGIVFSQFTNMLDLVSYRLKKANIGCVMLAGSMSIIQRNSILYSFNKFPDLKLILISLKAGGEGLNLQVANYVFLLDPWWNPAVELQAFQRAHRIGQKKEVTALRFITKDTIEERMFQLQEKKQLVFDGTVGASNNALNKLNSDDLKFLFQN